MSGMLANIQSTWDDLEYSVRCSDEGALRDNADAAVLDMARLIEAVRAVESLIEKPFASADKSHYADDFNRGHVAGYNAAANLLRKALDSALGDAT